ncbi:MAG: hypothetical protein U0324_03445 [Polyangiales bacterium]
MKEADDRFFEDALPWAAEDAPCEAHDALSRVVRDLAAARACNDVAPAAATALGPLLERAALAVQHARTLRERARRLLREGRHLQLVAALTRLAGRAAMKLPLRAR